MMSAQPWRRRDGGCARHGSGAVGVTWVSLPVNGVGMGLTSERERMAAPGVYRITFSVPEPAPEGPMEVCVRAGGAWSGPVQLAVAARASGVI